MNVDHKYLALSLFYETGLSRFCREWLCFSRGCVWVWSPRKMNNLRDYSCFFLSCLLLWMFFFIVFLSLFVFFHLSFSLSFFTFFPSANEVFFSFCMLFYSPLLNIILGVFFSILLFPALSILPTPLFFSFSLSLSLFSWVFLLNHFKIIYLFSMTWTGVYLSDVWHVCC